MFTEQQGHSRGVLKHCRGDTPSSYSRLFQVYALPGIPGICNLIFKMLSVEKGKKQNLQKNIERKHLVLEDHLNLNQTTN